MAVGGQTETSCPRLTALESIAPGLLSISFGWFAQQCSAYNCSEFFLAASWPDTKSAPIWYGTVQGRIRTGAPSVDSHIGMAESRLESEEFNVANCHKVPVRVPGIDGSDLNRNGAHLGRVVDAQCLCLRILRRDRL